MRLFSFYISGGGVLLSAIILSAALDTAEQTKFEKIYYKYKNTLFHQAMSILKNESDAEDVLQNAFIKIAKNINAVKDVNSKETLSFLIVITRNTAYDHLRKSAKTNELPLEDIDSIKASDDHIEDLVNRLEYEKIVSVITAIPSPYNEVLYLHYVKELSAKKIAHFLDRNISTVKMQLVRGKRILIKNLTEVLYE